MFWYKWTISFFVLILTRRVSILYNMVECDVNALEIIYFRT